MNKHKRNLLMVGDDQLNPSFSKRRIKECARDLFIMIASAWYLLNIFNVYAGGHDKTINFKNDIEPKIHFKIYCCSSANYYSSIVEHAFPR